MEGASFLFCCLAENIPCAQIRSISNKVEKRNKDAWNFPLALANLQITVWKIIEKF
jgi:futalosine hydrolase